MFRRPLGNPVAWISSGAPDKQEVAVCSQTQEGMFKTQLGWEKSVGQTLFSSWTPRTYVCSLQFTVNKNNK